MRHVLSVTGIRSEYDILYPVYQAISSHPELSLSIIVTGAHLSPSYGLTIEQIRKDGFPIAACVENLVEGDRDYDRLKGAAIQLTGLASEVHRLRPDILLAFGDREEAINVAYVGSYLNIPVCHISGGDRVIGNVDDQVRHAVTKLSHLHLTTNEESKTRILRMGEQPFRVFDVGNPGLDRIAETPKMGRDELLKWYGFKEDSFHQPLILLIQHSLSSEISDAYGQMKATMEAVKALQFNTVISYPNSDPGSRDIIRCLHESESLPFIRIFKNIPRLEFVNTLRHASCLVGNSSAGLLEAPFLKLPVVNTGNRQKGRLHAENVQFVPQDTEAIKEAIKKACFDEDYRKVVSQCLSPYGDGHAAEKIVKILAEVKLDKDFRIKDITY